ncbi:N-6 DNA methylase [Sphingomonas sp. CGMCC 1.13654]|uniref:site-specific DNA-methyltransferase (adenine-specific) n=1 Tax=Sphingomonas chungangi TaxID=2683589 RepID=A0A838LAN5_9SPHN|nr:type ISP restriction/modification enzyme [Sphingomonas chungangi]MBA2935649.1 N-6 DNA methylase [Sphingomonas chungangi]MVW54340.1 N-6 DNA methylase [Sphingomonas chungangi]
MTPTVAAVETYLRRMSEIRSTGGATKETSYYSALENLLNELGKALKPNVICNGQLRNQGAGHPDFGLYSRTQCQDGEPKAGQGEIPERGVIEVKALSDKNWQTAYGKQATRYFDHYRLVLVTNYREFRLIGEDEAGKPVEREFYALADDEAEFWRLAASPRKSAEALGTYFGDFLQRVMMNAAPLVRPKDVAWFLASYARDALTTLGQRDSANLSELRAALEIALGIKFEGEKGEHFFLSTLVQTLFYGIFSAWVIWAKKGIGRFTWQSAAYVITVPMIRILFEEIAKPSRLAPLGITHILDRASDALNRVDREAFFKDFDDTDAVQHFYEPFLEAYDPELRKEMGVWYTPKEIVRYMVERVDMALRTELGIEDGLADENVYILDPCCGTGAYVIEVLRKINSTLRAKNDDPLVGQDVKLAAQKRIFGFEIMSAPFVIAHWQIGELLDGFDAPIDAEKGERPGIYLTNALTGWEPPVGAKATLSMFPELEQERDQAEHVKREVPVLVVLGNPPYNAFAGTSPDEESGLVEPYKDGLISDWRIKKFNLDELYVRFLRVAERRIRTTGRGVISYISSYSYLSDPSFVVARQKLLEGFDEIWIDSLNGDSRETGKKTPDGAPDPSIFSTSYNRAGIRVGTAVGTFVRRGDPSGNAIVRYRDFWGAGKREQLLASLEPESNEHPYEAANPQAWNRLSFRPRDVGTAYLAWPKLIDLAEADPINGLMEKRAGALIDIEPASIESRMRQYFDADFDWDTLKKQGHPLLRDAARYDAKKARSKILSANVGYSADQLVRYVVRPFDVRSAYYSENRPLWNEPRPALWKQFSGGNRFLMSRPSGVAQPEGVPLFFTRCLGDNDALRGHAYYIPFTKREPAQGLLPASSGPNLSIIARTWLDAIGMPNPDHDAQSAEAPWLHALAIAYSPLYLEENAAGVAIDWPRLPLPNARQQLEASVALGASVSALLDGEAQVPGVTSGTVAPHLRLLGRISNTNLKVTAGWGARDSKGKINPGRGRTTIRDWTDEERHVIREGLLAQGIEEDRGFGLLGHAVDVHLNDDTCWSGIPAAAWDYVIGGYNVMKKWLSYREEAVMGRALTTSEAREITGMARRLTSLVLLTDKLNFNYEGCRDDAYSLPG